MEIAKAISLDARVLIMDEPTAALSGVEVDRLFAVTRTLQAQGAAVRFISHRFEEVFALADWITVMRDGAHVATAPAAELTVDGVIRQMVGRDVASLFPKQETQIGATALEVKGLSRKGVFSDISFTVKAGEIVGLSGLVGAGRSEVARAVFGIDKYDSGEVLVRERAAEVLVPPGIDGRRARVRAGRPAQAGPGHGAEREPEPHADAPAETEPFRPPHQPGRGPGHQGMGQETPDQGGITDVPDLNSFRRQPAEGRAGQMAGHRPKVLIIDEPTRGIDVGTKAEVHRLISELAGTGLAVLMISSELPEILGMSDRVLVMHEGRITAELSRNDATEESVMTAATGVDPNTKETTA